MIMDRPPLKIHISLQQNFRGEKVIIASQGKKLQNSRDTIVILYATVISNLLILLFYWVVCQCHLYDMYWYRKGNWKIKLVTMSTSITMSFQMVRAIRVYILPWNHTKGHFWQSPETYVFFQGPKARNLNEGGENVFALIIELKIDLFHEKKIE